MVGAIRDVTGYPIVLLLNLARNSTQETLRSHVVNALSIAGILVSHVALLL